jgi:hypothetical protein
VIGAREGALMDLIEGIAATLDTLADEHKAGNAQNVGERIARSVFAARAFVRTIRENESLPDTLEPGWNRPAPANVDDVVGVLEDAAERVGMGDSFEGTITWEMPTGEPELEGADFGLIARYRIGNLQGQGGLRVFTKADDGPGA